MSDLFPEMSLHNVNWIKEKPIAHRGLHNAQQGVYENTLSATNAAIDAGYNIEVDLHISADKVPIVFHDLTLDRLTERSGSVRDLTMAELSQISIMGTKDKIPSLNEFLDLVNGQVGVVLELKGHEDEAQDIGFIKAVATALEKYPGDAAIMSFDHHLLKDARKLAPHLPLGLTAYMDNSAYETHLNIAQTCDVDFISYELANLDSKFVKVFKKSDRPVISWTVKNTEDLAMSNKFADQPTFEGFRP